ncbi:hypothetical protein, partial [Pseudomonas sp. MWU12-2323]|uniref:hypothetical protein n=1 Tax=Pseudomonas sp. MWU12-2323 TaxID=2651296 RepID=UPI001381873C
LKDDSELNQFLLQLALEKAELIPAEGATALSGDTLGEIARQFLLTRSVIDRESRVIDPLVLEAMLKTGPLSLSSQQEADAALAKLSALLPADAIELQLLRDEKNDGHLIKIIRKLHGNVMVTVMDQDFLESGDYAEMKKTGDMLSGLL